MELVNYMGHHVLFVSLSLSISVSFLIVVTIIIVIIVVTMGQISFGAFTAGSREEFIDLVLVFLAQKVLSLSLLLG